MTKDKEFINNFIDLWLKYLDQNNSYNKILTICMEYGLKETKRATAKEIYDKFFEVLKEKHDLNFFIDWLEEKYDITEVAE